MRDAARHGEVARRDERLHLEQDRARALERARDGRARLAVDGAPEHLGRIGNADEAGARHLEHADLVRRAEAVLHGTQHAVCAIPVAFELQHAVDEMLEYARARDGAVLRHMADEDRRDAVLLRDAQQPAGRLAHLRNRARSRAELGRVERLHRVDHADLGTFRLERLADDVELGLGEDLDVRRAAEPLRAELHLSDGLLARDQKHTALAAHRLERSEQERRLADAGLAADEDERRRDDAAAEHAVELGDAGGDPLRVLDLDVDEPQERLGRLPAPDLVPASSSWDLLDERAERVAARALAEPAPGRVAAVGAGKLNGRFRHQTSLRRLSDARVKPSAQLRHGKEKATRRWVAFLLRGELEAPGPRRIGARGDVPSDQDCA